MYSHLRPGWPTGYLKKTVIALQVKSVIENVINADIPIRGLGWLTGYLAMLLGAIMTILVQSSSGWIRITFMRLYG
jgi:hypothetical protein